MIQKCIDELEYMNQNDKNFQLIIHDFPRLKYTLQNLDSLVEMYAVKTVIVDHIRMLIVLAYKALLSGTKPEECYKGHMLHTVFYGSPGVGKSRTAFYLAEIWKALGVLQKPIQKAKQFTTHDVLSKINHIRSQFLDLYEKQKANPKTAFKHSYTQWETIKNELKEFGDELSYEKTIIQENDVIIKCGREDFVAEYAGQTAIKTHTFLTQNLGKCIIIEEAYLLYTGESDHYGMEAITVLNRFMEEHSESLIVIFTGYEENLQNTIFKAQPGLKRRCQWIFHLQGYSPKGLQLIFENQLEKMNWKIAKDISLESFFTNKINYFPNYGGDTQKLALHCKTKYSSEIFPEIYHSIVKNKVLQLQDIPCEITQELLEKAFEEYRLHQL